MQFNNYVGDYKNCKVYIASIIVFDCNLQYSAYQWSFLFRNAASNPGRGYTVNKQSDIFYKLKRLIDPNYSDGEGDFFMLKQSNQYNVNNVISRFTLTRGNNNQNGVIE